MDHRSPNPGPTDAEELGREFLAHRARITEMLAVGGWHRYADDFTIDGVYRRTGVPDVIGREAIRPWVVGHMTSYPGDRIARLDVAWHVLDPSRSAVVYEYRCVLEDPGDGSVHTASTTCSQTYAGNGLWSLAVDILNPRSFAQMYATWTAVAHRTGLLVVPDDARSLTANPPGPLPA